MSSTHNSTKRPPLPGGAGSFSQGGQPQARPPAPQPRAVLYGIKHPSMAMCSLPSSATTGVGSDEAARFLVGSATTRGPAEVHLLEVSSEPADPAADAGDSCGPIRSSFYHHPRGQICDISSSPHNSSWFATSSVDAASGENFVTVWGATFPFSPGSPSLPASGNPGDNSPPLKMIASLSGLKSQVNNQGEFATIDQAGALCLFNFAGSTATATNPAPANRTATISTADFGVANPSPLLACSWNPHQDAQIVTSAQDGSLTVWDIRSKRPAIRTTSAHGLKVPVRAVDHNPLAASFLASGGDDGSVRIWDIRNMGSGPVKTTLSHTHWVWSVEYNHFYDELLLSAGSDSRVHLENVGSHVSGSSSYSAGESTHSDSGLPASSPTPSRSRAGPVHTYTPHEESVYSARWSASEPWILASVSYDGRVAINVVPRSEKLRLLL
ncbi:hypothetical protein H696_03824 [Fonticula alba]|uniref:EIPR1-like beta-propeller domain-containing protein n=1 Tax=Fonticula alba TaxID=691883 RepID=A0A058Z637_FONAL|nr:hypothetical protein H696_03824 [Fonticula alba]KCV69393.1 hypothetical protein H696_03824 [Fonticula alba]|eukprot:XP_009495958.1 hypothetical protein H696_03824 [Fonticula alba]